MQRNALFQTQSFNLLCIHTVYLKFKRLARLGPFHVRIAQSDVYVSHGFHSDLEGDYYLLKFLGGFVSTLSFIWLLCFEEGRRLVNLFQRKFFHSCL